MARSYRRVKRRSGPRPRLQSSKSRSTPRPAIAIRPTKQRSQTRLLIKSWSWRCWRDLITGMARSYRRVKRRSGPCPRLQSSKPRSTPRPAIASSKPRNTPTPAIAVWPTKQRSQTRLLIKSWSWRCWRDLITGMARSYRRVKRRSGPCPRLQSSKPRSTPRPAIASSKPRNTPTPAIAI